jgi:hypothetical protein
VHESSSVFVFLLSVFFFFFFFFFHFSSTNTRASPPVPASNGANPYARTRSAIVRCAPPIDATQSATSRANGNTASSYTKQNLTTHNQSSPLSLSHIHRNRLERASRLARVEFGARDRLSRLVQHRAIGLLLVRRSGICRRGL